MDAALDYTDPVSWEKPPTSPQVVAGEKLERFDKLDSPWTSCRQIARQVEVPDSTLRYWLRRRWARMEDSSWSRRAVQFFETPDGLACLHQVATAAHLVFVEANNCGIRSLCWFLELSGLDEFIAPSYGAQQAVAEAMESLLIAFGGQEHQRLAAQMPPREITLCEDETFHPEICLVAIEPVSNFILLEQYQPQRDADTWNRCLDEKLAVLPITVCQVVSDQARALITHTEMHLGAHHSPDLFHVQYETAQATSLALAGQTRHAEQQLAKAEQKTASLREQWEACRQQCPESSHGEVLEQQLQQAEGEQATARQHLGACQDRQQRAADARRGLSRDDHPFDLDSGQPLQADEVAGRLAGHFDTLQRVAAEAGLSSHAVEKLAKARRVLDAMKATIAFFWTMIAVRFWAWNLPEPVQQWMREALIPGYYLACVAHKASTAAERQRLRELSETILARARSPDGLWGTLGPNIQADLEQKAQACAELFQRSSSCVEGRNGHLSLKHHALHQLTSRKLKALTVLHNYLVRRAHGSTAAERFYGAAPRDLFSWLLERVSVPARPRARRRAA